MPPSHFALLLLLFSFSFDFALFSSTVLRIHICNVTFNVTITLSASAFSSHSFNLLRFNWASLSWLRMQTGTLPSVCLRLCLLPLFPFTLSSFCSLCVFVSSGLHEVIPSIRRLIPTFDSSQSLRRVFCHPFFHCCFDFGFNVMIFVVLERFNCTCSGHYLSVCRYTSWQSVDFDLHERYICVLYECSIWSILFFLDQIFLLHPWQMISLFVVLSAFFNMFADLRNVSLFIVVCELQKRMCDRLGWSLAVNLIRWHSHRSFDFWVCLELLVLSCRREILSIQPFSGSGLLVSCCIPCRLLRSGILCCLGLPAYSSFSKSVDTSDHIFIVTNHKVFYDVAFRSNVPRFCACQKKSILWKTHLCFKNGHMRIHTRTPKKTTLHHQSMHSDTDTDQKHLDQPRNCLFCLSRINVCALLNLCWSIREWLVAARGRRWTWRLLESDVSSGNSAGSIAKVHGWPSSSVRQRVAAIKRGDPSPRYIGGSPRRLTPELLDEIHEFIEEHGRNRFPCVALASVGDPHSAPSARPSHPWSSQVRWGDAGEVGAWIWTAHPEEDLDESTAGFERDLLQRWEILIAVAVAPNRSFYTFLSEENGVT